MITQEVDQAVATLQSGGVVAYPTETYIGLAVDPSIAGAVTKLANLKQRPIDKPFPYIVCSRQMAANVGDVTSEVAQKLIAAFWPGPLTLVLPVKTDYRYLASSDGTVALRYSSHPLSCDIVSKLGRPITATSANPANGKPAKTLSDANIYFGDLVQCYLTDSKPRLTDLAIDLPSTIVEISKHCGANNWRVLRHGQVSDNDILNTLA